MLVRDTGIEPVTACIAAGWVDLELRGSELTPQGIPSE